MITVLTAVESRDGLLKKTGEEFLRSVKLIESLDDELYAGAKKSNGSIGAHFRHNIEIVDNFLYGLKAGKIDYGNRERDIRIEQDRSYAIERIGYLIDGLRELPGEFFHMEVLVRSEIDLDTWSLSSRKETVPKNACQFFYECGGCKIVLRPKLGDCCVYCSHGSVACPPVQSASSCCSV